MDITVGAVIVAVVATIVGSTIQGAIGFGMNLVTVPALVLVLPEALPVAVIVLGIPISIAMVRHERHGLDRPGLAWLLSGRVPGTVLGALIVVSVSATSLQVIVGSVVLLLVVASAAMSPVAINRSTQLTAGFASGVTSTCAGIGGPPVALLYQRRGGAEIRSTLSATFLVGTFMSLTALAIAGEVGADQMAVGAGLTPAVLAGTLVGRRLHDVLDRGWLRPAVLAFAFVAALVVLADALL